MIVIESVLIIDAKNGCQRAKMDVINRMNPVIKKKCMHVPYEWYDDATQSCILAILIALTKFDVSRSENFIEFAKRYIGNEINKLLNECVIAPCAIPREVVSVYFEAKKKADSPVCLPNGMRVDSLEQLMSYTYLRQYG